MLFCFSVCLFVTYGDLYELDRIRLGDARVYPPLDQVDQDWHQVDDNRRKGNLHSFFESIHQSSNRAGRTRTNPYGTVSSRQRWNHGFPQLTTNNKHTNKILDTTIKSRLACNGSKTTKIIKIMLNSVSALFITPSPLPKKNKHILKETFKKCKE